MHSAISWVLESYFFFLWLLLHFVFQMIVNLMWIYLHLFKLKIILLHYWLIELFRFYIYLLVLNIFFLVKWVYFLIFSLIYLSHCLVHKIWSSKIISGLKGFSLSTWVRESIFKKRVLFFEVIINGLARACFIRMRIGTSILILIILGLCDYEITFFFNLLFFMQIW